jgi:hypothetical protein
MSNHNTQQEWLVAAYVAMQAKYLPEAPNVENVVLTYGFPKGKGGRKGSQAIGQCWFDPCPTANAVILIHPCQWTTPVDVLHVLLHEAVHAAVGCACGHKGPFKTLATRVGLTGKMTATVPSDSLRAELEAMAESLPAFPSAGFNPSGMGGGKKGSTLRRFVCPCDVKVRVGSDNFEATCDLCGGKFERSELQ